MGKLLHTPLIYRYLHYIILITMGHVEKVSREERWKSFDC